MVGVGVCRAGIGLGLGRFVGKEEFNKAEEEMGKG